MCSLAYAHQPRRKLSSQTLTAPTIPHHPNHVKMAALSRCRYATKSSSSIFTGTHSKGLRRHASRGAIDEAKAANVIRQVRARPNSTCSCLLETSNSCPGPSTTYGLLTPPLFRETRHKNIEMWNKLMITTGDSEWLAIMKEGKSRGVDLNYPTGEGETLLFTVTF